AVLFLHRDRAVLGSGQQLAGNRSDAVLFGLKDSHNRPLLSKTNKKTGESSMISALSPTLFYYSQLSQKCQTISSKRSAFGYSESKSHPHVPQICCARCSACTSSSRFSCPSSQRRDGSAINSQPEPAKRSRIPCSSSIV